MKSTTSRSRLVTLRTGWLYGVPFDVEKNSQKGWREAEADGDSEKNFRFVEGLTVKSQVY